MRKKEKGITLIALTITIIVLLILASIATYTGLSTIKSSKLTRFKQELEIMQAHVDKLYEECKNSDGTLDMDKVNAIGKDLTNLDIEEINNIFDSLNMDNTDDYRYFDKETLESLGITGLDDEYLVSIKDRNVISRYGFENDGIMYRNLYQFPDKERISGDINRGDVSFLLDFQKVSDGWNINVTNIKFSKYVGKGNIKYKKSDSYDWITVEENAKQSDYSFKVTSSGKYIVKVTDAAGISAEQEIAISDGGTCGKRFDEDTTITIGDDKVSIPGGATISKVPGECGNVDNGLVIYIIPKDETPDWDADDNSNGILDVQEKYDQFVWVPVPNPVLDLSSNFSSLDEAGIKAEVQKEIDAGRYPMAIKKNATDYIGVLYQFTEEGGKVKVEPLTNDVNGYKWTPLSTAGCREPAYLSDSSYGDESSYNNTNPKVSQDLLQQEFNTMVEKVSAQKGFWIGRYETSSMYGGSDGHDNSKDTKNKIKVVKGTVNGINKVSWYRMYAQQKTYRSLTEISSSRTSSMIWGSQWDQVMIWLKEVKNESKGSYYVVNSSGMGNYGTADDTDTDINNPAPTGNSERYKVKNIYDLAGNIYDRTLEVNNIDGRVHRRRWMQYH